MAASNNAPDFDVVVAIIFVVVSIFSAVMSKIRQGLQARRREAQSGQKATEINTVDWALKATELGAGEILLTSMDADGHKTGYDIELTRAISDAVSVPVIASGGAGDVKDLEQALSLGKADAVLAASIFHYKTHSIQQIKQYLANKGIAVRV